MVFLTITRAYLQRTLSVSMWLIEKKKWVFGVWRCNTVNSRQYSETHQRALQVLQQETISPTDVYFVLSALPQPKNTRRVGVIPDGQAFVHSQAAGLTTQQGLRPTLSSLCHRCPSLITLLSRFVLQHDPHFTFTTITINYNYASAAHRDVNHVDGAARIIGLGNYSGGELHIEDEGDIEIHNTWFDFDGRKLHSTRPFEGERYSLVYFTHVACLRPEAESLFSRMLALGIPIPAANRNVSDMKEAAILDNSISACQYIIFPSLLQTHYKHFVSAETASLFHLYDPSASLHSEQLMIISSTPDAAAAVARRAVSFLLLQVVATSTVLESLRQVLEASQHGPLPPNYALDIHSYGRKLSTRQRRKVLMQASFDRPVCNSSSLPVQYHLVLVHDEHAIDETGNKGVLTQAYLCKELVVAPSNPTIASSDDNEVMSDAADSSQYATTALKPAMSRLLCNLACVTSASMCYDPFCGSGSLLVAAREAGGICVGSDVQLFKINIDIEVFVSNIYHNPVIGTFDVILCDPPYGRRERHVDSKGCGYAHHNSNEERALSQFKILTPLFALAAAVLRPGGRLVFPFINFPMSETVCWRPEDLPKEPSLQLLHHCREQWEYKSGHCIARDTIVMEKLDYS